MCTTALWVSSGVGRAGGGGSPLLLAADCVWAGGGTLGGGGCLRNCSIVGTVMAKKGVDTEGCMLGGSAAARDGGGEVGSPVAQLVDEGTGAAEFQGSFAMAGAGDASAPLGGRARCPRVSVQGRG